MIESVFSIKELSENDVTVVRQDTGAKIPHLCFLPNTESGRNELQNILPPDLLNEVMEVWGASPTISPEPEPEMAIEEVRALKQAQIKQWCQERIYMGVDVDTGIVDGPLHYSLTDRYQQDLIVQMGLVKEGLQMVLWRDDSKVEHDEYTAEQFTTLYNAAMHHVLSNRVHSDALEAFVLTLNDPREVREVTWESELPQDIKDRRDGKLQRYFGGIQSLVSGGD